ncbi:gamma-tubulin complex component 5 [Diabrotica undecimpunctata]|uniref:gamma-tubulin complex component 5 n=1 Tax=Diabrotica undecimpunctata TaxID=50387 RepID=UPI003B63C67A
MARQLSREIADAVKDLITQVTGFEDNSEAFNVVQKYFHEKLRKSDTMYFLNKTEVDKSIEGMAEKYNFHGFFSQSKALVESYNEYITQHVSKAHLTAQLNVVKFLLCMSEKPTVKFLENPEKFEVKLEPEREEINWGEYLKEGIENSIPRFDESTDASDVSSVADDRDIPDCFAVPTTSSAVVIPRCETDVILNFRANREELLNTVQHTWYNENIFFNIPFSERREANIGILWEHFLEKQAMNLVVINKSNVISEYKVIREILWQLWEPHTSSVFYFEEKLLKPRKNITISSVRSASFENFLENQIMPHIQLLDFFRDFEKELSIHSEETIMLVPQTYRSYNSSLQRLIRPVYLKLSQLEDTIREQESTYTLVNLSQDLQEILEPVILLKKLHDTVVIKFSENSNIILCATTLLARLHNSLQHSVNKLDQDLKVTLYIESLYHYFTVINSWFMKNDLSDYSDEFIITKVTGTDYFKLNPEISTGAGKVCREDGILNIISTTVLQIGKNLHLIRLLEDFSLLNENTETIYEEFVRRSLEELCSFFDSDLMPKDTCETDKELEGEISYKFPVIWSDDISQPTEMDKLENLVDTSDGFLMLAFEDYFKSEETHQKSEEITLYEKISKITKTFFPVTNFFEKILNTILREHFTISGLKVKKILIEQHHLEKQFQFLRHIFLFFDNLIFPFYRRFFIKVYAQSKNWGNDIWLTSHLQDIIMDIYPDFYENCYVQVNKNWKACNDALEACNMISVNIEIPWPLNIIISSSQMTIYKDIFHFILKIKWGLYTLNHLSFTDLEPRKERNKTKFGSNKSTIMKLKYLRFALINFLNRVHHYIFSFVFVKCLHKFELDFESANDLSSIISSHAEFINNANILIGQIRENGVKDTSFDSVAKCIKALKYMWENVSFATPERLNDMNESYKRSYDIINPIISPVFVFDY